MRRNSSFRQSAIFGNYTSISRGDFNEEKKRPPSLMYSQRKPIFEQSMYSSTTAKFAVNRPIPSDLKIQKVTQTTYDDFCGCEHNLEPCDHIVSLL